MKTFEEAWAATGRDYGPDALDNVKCGWDLACEQAIREDRDYKRIAQQLEDHVRLLAEQLREANVRATKSQQVCNDTAQSRDRWELRVRELERRIDRVRNALSGK